MSRAGPGGGSAAPAGGFVRFEVLRTAGTEAAAALVDTLTQETRDVMTRAPGFRSARIHLGTDGTTVITRAEWAGEEDHRTHLLRHPAARAPRDLPDRPEVVAATSFHGTRVPGIEGPAAHSRPGVAVLATRHLSGPEGTAAVLDLLSRSGEWKRRFPGFVGAAPCVSPDGRTFVNYPLWVSESAYRSWMADPRIAEGQEELARLEVAPPEYLVCTVAAQLDAVRGADGPAPDSAPAQEGPVP